jgi:hypothetical protein
MFQYFNPVNIFSTHLHLHFHYYVDPILPFSNEPAQEISNKILCTLFVSVTRAMLCILNGEIWMSESRVLPSFFYLTSPKDTAV